MARGPNWLSKEDTRLAWSTLHTSKNPIYANAMKRDQFWEPAAKHFNQNSPGGHQEGSTSMGQAPSSCDKILSDVHIH
ncbi:hypothetical protein PGT21_000940 [Puccinia graminis f. sp. tritici]|uniref:No apical meristem-associated C-terminal domain-containing protein n=1 Tax=Puccinia graminis f. sp. tritici TaxID=56615 RepID=A0A5B0Q1G1_PUCGR|nr:hypothetical protein PGT21_000940 [Puccinia graminis f. sp. tritici]